MAEHRLDGSSIHHAWGRTLEPVLEVRSGDIVRLDLVMAGAGQVSRVSRCEDTTFDLDSLYHLAGPIFVDGAEPVTPSRSRCSS